MMNIKTCQAKTNAGSQCQAATIDHSSFCFFHDPSYAEERRRAQSSGGRNGVAKTLPASTADMDIRSMEGVTALLCETINQVRRGDVDPRIGNSIGYLANILMKSIEQGEMEERLRSLEAAVLSRPLPDLDMTEGDDDDID